MNNPRFTIYRLKIEPFMSGAPISEDVAEKVAEYILLILWILSLLMVMENP